jgi:hypothetical protein
MRPGRIRPVVVAVAGLAVALLLTCAYFLAPRRAVLSSRNRGAAGRDSSLNVLIAGRDARAVGPVTNDGRQRNKREARSHSDIIIVCHINFGAENGDCTERRALRGTVPDFRPAVNLVAIPRDLLVEVPGVTSASSHTDFTSMEKIAHTYAIGGDKLLRRTVENLLGIKIQRSIAFDFDSFRMAFDLLRPFIGELRVGGVSLTEKNQALKFARRRHGLPYDDADRCRNALLLVRGIVNRAWWLSDTRLGDILIRRVLAIVGKDTDFTAGEVRGVVSGLRAAGFSAAWTRTAVLVGTGADVTLARYNATLSCYLPVYAEMEKQVNRYLLDRPEVAALDFMTNERFRVPLYIESSYVTAADTVDSAPPLPFDTSVPDSQGKQDKLKELNPADKRLKAPNPKPQAPDTGHGPTRK